MENWRFIKENNDYMVSDHGRIMSLKKPQKKILSSSLLHNGYEAIYIYQKGIHAARYVHRLVAETFIPQPEKTPASEPPRRKYAQQSCVQPRMVRRLRQLDARYPHRASSR